MYAVMNLHWIKEDLLVSVRVGLNLFVWEISTV